MNSVQRGPLGAIAGEVVVLALVSAVTGLSPLGWVVGLAYGFGLAAALQFALVRRGKPELGPADWVTLTRAVLVGGVAALLAGYPAISIPVFTCLVAVALVLDGVDGQVARRTGTASELGARFDMEVDAFLILVMSLQVSRELGWWVLAIGLARYAFVIASWGAAWMRRPLPFRYWRKVVAASQGVALLIAASGWLPAHAATLLVLLALCLLVESFGRDVLWLWHSRDEHAIDATKAATLAEVTPIRPGP